MLCLFIFNTKIYPFFLTSIFHDTNYIISIKHKDNPPCTIIKLTPIHTIWQETRINTLYKFLPIDGATVVGSTKRKSILEQE